MIRLGIASLLLVCFASANAASVEFCLDGSLDLGARYQGLAPSPGEPVSTRWCVVTNDEDTRVLFSAEGQANHDLDGSWAIAYLPPDTVRLVNRDHPPDIEFVGAYSADEAARVRRLDPKRLASELESGNGRVKDLDIEIEDGLVRNVRTMVDLPLRGRVVAEWKWQWQPHPTAVLYVDGEPIFEGRASWRELIGGEAEAMWALSGGESPVDVPGDAWPSQVNMSLVELAEDTYLVRGVRTGFQHLVVETADGLVVADAPAGWVEMHQLPPADVVPGLGISGLSEALIDFLTEALPGRDIAAVALTHHHNDHAGGARAFAAAGASIYAPAPVARFLGEALNSPSMPADRLSKMSGSLDVTPVAGNVSIGRGKVRLMTLGPGPHVNAVLGVFATDSGYFFVSDIHVPGSNADAPAPERSKTECWFAAWAVDHLPATATVINSHTAAQTPVARLRRYLASDPCAS